MKSPSAAPRSAITRNGPSPLYGQCAKRLSITEAAEIVFARDGFAAASIDTIAATAGVSRQTIYNHYGDKERLFVAVVTDMTERANAGLFAVIAAFPDHPADLHAALVDFARALMLNCMCNRDGLALRRLIQAEGERYPQLFAAWREHGPGKSWSLIGARFARLAHDGRLRIDDPDLAARQFMALVNADIQMATLLGGRPTAEEIDRAAANAARTFLRAFGTGERAAEAPPRKTAMSSAPPALA
jgi:AcrR family transcriptional regulator